MPDDDFAEWGEEWGDEDEKMCLKQEKRILERGDRDAGDDEEDVSQEDEAEALILRQ